MNASNATIECVVLNEYTVLCGDEEFASESLYKPGDWRFWLFLILYLVLVLFAGLMSGLTMGLLSLDKMSLEVLRRGGKPHQKKYATRILMIVKHHHLLLVTLLLANALAVEGMPVVLSKITNEIIAIVVSVTAVLMFGEIIPQSICTRYGLAIGYYFSPLVIGLMVVFIPIGFPLSLVLDCVLGAGHGTFFRRAELRELVKMHGATHDNKDPLSLDEVLIVKGALDMRYKKVVDAMTPLESVYMLEVTRRVDLKTMRELLEKGHSRIPVYRGSMDNICGLLLVKKLIQLDPEDCTPVQTLEGARTPPPSSLTTTPLYDQLNTFQTGRSHLNLVYQQGEHDTDLTLVGIITLEDVIEELIGEEIVDETDQYVDVHRRIAVARARLANMRHTASAPVGVRADTRGRAPARATRHLSQPTNSEASLAIPSASISSKPSLEPLMSTDASGGGLDLESVYNAATPISFEAGDTMLDESEEAPLIANIN